MKTVAKHETMLQDIRRVSFLFAWCGKGIGSADSWKMIKNQHEHEELWFRGREALIEKQKVRKEGQKKLDDVL